MHVREATISCGIPVLDWFVVFGTRGLLAHPRRAPLPAQR
jgi:hypothetical protein